MEQKKAITISALIIMALFILYSARAAPLISDENYTYISGMTWYNTYEAGKKAAMEENKPMLIYVWATWCKFCEKLHTDVYPDPRISKILKEDIVLVAIDLDRNREDAQRFGIQYPPYLLFLTPEGERITAIPGFVPADDLFRVLDQIATRRREIIVAHKDLPHS